MSIRTQKTAVGFTLLATVVVGLSGWPVPEALPGTARADGRGEAPVAQSPSPELVALWGDSDAWPVVEPGAVRTRRLRPVRSVYRRTVDMLTDPLEVRAVWEIDQTRYDGRPALRISWYSSGGAPSMLTSYVDIDTMRSLFHLRAFRSNREIRHVVEGGYRQVAIGADGTTSTQHLETERPVFDLMVRGQTLAAIDLHDGQRFRLAYYHAPSNSLQSSIMRVTGRVELRTERGVRHTVWQVDTPQGFEGWTNRYWVDAEPPYLFGFEAVNILTGEVDMRVSLLEHGSLE